jgi:hypothetical protein
MDRIMSFNVGDLVTSKEYLLGLIYRVDEIGPKDTFLLNHPFRHDKSEAGYDFMKDFRRATKKEISDYIATRMLKQ